MTDVVVQHLITNQDIRIQCKDYVKKLAVYKGCLAVQLPKQITIYQLKLGADADDMLYTPVAVIEQELECNLLVVTAQHLTLCQVCPSCHETTLPYEWCCQGAALHLKLLVDWV